MKKSEKKSGGARKGSGPKLKYGEPCKNFVLNAPVSKIPEIKAAVSKMKQKWEVKKPK